MIYEYVNGFSICFSHRFSCLAEELADAFYGNFNKRPLSLHLRHQQWTMLLFGRVEILLWLSGEAWMWRTFEIC